MKNKKWILVMALSFTLLLANSFTSVAQNTDRKKMAGEIYMEGYNLQAEGKYREASEKYTVAIGLDSTFALAYYSRCEVRYALEDFKGVLEDCNKYISLDSDPFLKSYSLRGLAKLKLEDYRGAIVDFNQTIQWWEDNEKKDKDVGLSPEDIRVGLSERDVQYDYHNRGGAKDILGDGKGACEDFLKACNMGLSYSCEIRGKRCDSSSVQSSSEQTQSPTGKTDGKAQNKSEIKCGLVGGMVYELQYNPLIGRNEGRFLYKYVYKCVPTRAGSN